jgi:hypothetical protein
MQKHLMIAVNWYGPYATIKAARESAREFYGEGLYFAIGRREGEARRSMQYIGIGGDIQTRLKNDHHKLKLVQSSLQIWLGEIATAGPSGRRLKITKPTLDYAEWLHAFYLPLQLNEKKTRSAPDRSVTVMNKWYSCKDWITPQNRPHPGWPDLIDYPHDDISNTKIVWFGEKMVESDSQPRTRQSPNFKITG